MAYEAKPNQVGVDNVRVNEALTQLAFEYGDRKLIALTAFPRRQADGQTGLYPIFGEQHFRHETAYRGTTDKARRIHDTYSTDSFRCEDYALDTFIPDKVVRNANDPAARLFLSKRRKVNFLKRTLMREHEIKFASLFAAGNFKTGLYNDGDAGTLGAAWANWDDANQNGMQQIEEAMGIVEDEIGVRPDSILMAQDLWSRIKYDTNLRGNSQTALMTREMFMELAEVDNFTVTGASYNSAKRGQTTVRTPIWGSNFLMLYFKGDVAPAGTDNEGLEDGSPTTAMTINFDMQEGMSNGELVREYRDNVAGGGGTVIEYAHCYDAKLTGKNPAGKIITAFRIDNAYSDL